jgi:hypothetical protein
MEVNKTIFKQMSNISKPQHKFMIDLLTAIQIRGDELVIQDNGALAVHFNNPCHRQTRKTGAFL